MARRILSVVVGVMVGVLLLGVPKNANADIGSNDYCKVAGPCGVGQGDCDSDQECQSGLTCVYDIGASYGFRSIVDVCEAPAIVNHNALGGNDHCKVAGPCAAGEGDCDGDHECKTGLVCVNDVGTNYGFRSIVDVCEAPVAFEFGTGVSTDDKNFIRDVVEHEKNFLYKETGYSLGAVDVFVYKDINEIVRKYSEVNGINITDSVYQMWRSIPAISGYANGHGYVFVYDEHPQWKGYSTEQKTATVAHEVFHSFGANLLGYWVGREEPQEISAAGYRWFLEGTASFYAGYSGTEAGFTPLSVGIAWWRDYARHNLQKVPLVDLETLEDFEKHVGEVYALGFLAVAQLVEKDGLHPLRTITKFFTHPSKDPDERFEAAFGLTVEEFYASFHY